MKEVNSKISMDKLSKFCRSTILSLFIILTLPAISSSIFGNGDANAGCNGGNVEITANNLKDDLFCGDNNGEAKKTYGNLCTAGMPIVAGTVSCGTLSEEQCVLVGSCGWTADTADSNKLVEAVCRVYKIATGTAGKAFAAIGVISVGIGFFTGKVSWGLMISVAAGIAVFFGAPSIIAVISGDDTAGMCSSY